MNNFKRVFAVMMAVVLVFAMTACGGDDKKDEGKTDSDKAYVQEKGKLVVGITDYAPMDFKEKKDGEWVGFDADMAKALQRAWALRLSLPKSTGTIRLWNWKERALMWYGTV